MSYRRVPKPKSFPHSPELAQADAMMREAMAVANVGASAPMQLTELDRPSVTVSLREDGGLQVDFAGVVLRSLALPSDPERAIAIIHRILAGQRAAQNAIGLDGAPIAAQVKDWSKQVVLRDDDGNAQVRKFAPRAKLASATTKTAEELGL